MENRRHTISAAPRTPVAADRPVRREPASAMAAVSLSLIKSQSSPSMGRTKRKVTPVRRASSAISNLGASDDEGAQFSDTDLKFLAASARKLLHDVYKANYETKEIKFDQRTTPQINHDIKLFNILVRFYGPLLDSSYERTAPLIPTQLHRALFDCSPEGCYIIQLASITGLVLSPTVAMYPDNTDMHIDSGSEPIAVTFHHYRRLLDVLVNVFGPSENVPAHLDMDVLTLAFDICTALEQYQEEPLSPLVLPIRKRLKEWCAGDAEKLQLLTQWTPPTPARLSDQVYPLDKEVDKMLLSTIMDLVPVFAEQIGIEKLESNSESGNESEHEDTIQSPANPPMTQLPDDLDLDAELPEQLMEDLLAASMLEPPPANPAATTAVAASEATQGPRRLRRRRSTSSAAASDDNDNDDVDVIRRTRKRRRVDDSGSETRRDENAMDVDEDDDEEEDGDDDTLLTPRARTTFTHDEVSAEIGSPTQTATSTAAPPERGGAVTRDLLSPPPPDASDDEYEQDDEEEDDEEEEGEKGHENSGAPGGSENAGQGTGDGDQPGSEEEEEEEEGEGEGDHQDAEAGQQQGRAAPADPAAEAAAATPARTVRRALFPRERIRWTPADEAVLEEALIRHEGLPHWTSILVEQGVEGTIDNRLAKFDVGKNAGQRLKEKARNIRKKRLAAGEDLGVFALNGGN